MSQKAEIAEQVAQKFTRLNDAEKNFVLGYLTGKQEERARQELDTRLQTSRAVRKPDGGGHGGAA